MLVWCFHVTVVFQFSYLQFQIDEKLAFQYIRSDTVPIHLLIIVLKGHLKFSISLSELAISYFKTKVALFCFVFPNNHCNMVHFKRQSKIL